MAEDCIFIREEKGAINAHFTGNGEIMSSIGTIDFQSLQKSKIDVVGMHFMILSGNQLHIPTLNKIKPNAMRDLFPRSSSNFYKFLVTRDQKKVVHCLTHSVSYASLQKAGPKFKYKFDLKVDKICGNCMRYVAIFLDLIFDGCLCTREMVFRLNSRGRSKKSVQDISNRYSLFPGKTVWTYQEQEKFLPEDQRDFFHSAWLKWVETRSQDKHETLKRYPEERWTSIDEAATILSRKFEQRIQDIENNETMVGLKKRLSEETFFDNPLPYVEEPKRKKKTPTDSPKKSSKPVAKQAKTNAKTVPRAIQKKNPPQYPSFDHANGHFPTFFHQPQYSFPQVNPSLNSNPLLQHIIQLSIPTQTQLSGTFFDMEAPYHSYPATLDNQSSPSPINLSANLVVGMIPQKTRKRKRTESNSIPKQRDVNKRMRKEAVPMGPIDQVPPLIIQPPSISEQKYNELFADTPQ